jgi:hypothetical protein
MGLRIVIHLPNDVRWGVKWGLYFGCAFSIQAAAAVWLAGSDADLLGGQSLGKLIAGYVGLGTVAGFIVGVLRPHLRSDRGAVAVGFVALAPFAFFGVSLVNDDLPIGVRIFLGCVAALFWSGIGAPLFRRWL